MRLLSATQVAAAVLAVCPVSFASGEPPATILVGGTLPLSGSEARSGAAFREGYDLAVAEVNARGGVRIAGRGVPVRLVIADDRSDKAAATQLAEKLITEDKVGLMLGTFNSASVEMQSTVAERHQVPYIAGSGAASALFQRGYKYLFGLQSPIKMLAFAELSWMEEEQAAGRLPRPTTIALAAEDTTHGKDFRAGVLKFIERKGSSWKVVLDETFPLDARDFKPLMGRVGAARADVFMADAHLPDFIAMHREYAAMKLCHKAVTYGARGGEKAAAQALGAGATDGILSAVWWNAELGSKGLNQRFVQSFAKRYGRAPDWYQALGYESVRVLLTAVEQAGTTAPEAVRAQLASMNLETILPGGRVNFPATFGQQAHYPFVVLQNQKGASPIIYPKYLATASGVVAKCPGAAVVVAP